MTTPDTSHRIHLAANDPAFPAKREAAFGAIMAAVASVVEPAGYALRGTTWARETAVGKTAVHLQRSRYGFDVEISLRCLLADGTLPETGPWAVADEVTLWHFAPDAASDPGTISYLDVHENAGCLAAPMAILRDQALPWLERHHAGESPEISPRPSP